MFNKRGELSTISAANVQSTEAVLAELDHKGITDKFSKFAKELKRVAPKADDFLYFTAVMITAAEAAALNEDGSLKKRADGVDVEVGWDVNEKTGSWKWRTNDDSIQAYANANGDIFPEVELVKAYKQWVGKPFCVDHKSTEVDAIRGVILDVYYDRVHKQAIGLVACDRVSYPELCRGITTGYKTCVSMGTAVGKAICYSCGQVASTERDFCNHMRTKSAKEINTELTPLELSCVATGADRLATIRTILASANAVRHELEEKSEEINKLAVDASSMGKFKELEEDLQKLSDKMKELKTSLEKEETDQNTAEAPVNAIDPHMPTGNNTGKNNEVEKSANNHAFSSELQDIKASVSEQFAEMNETLKSLSQKINEDIKMANSNKPNDLNKAAYYQSGNSESDPSPGKPKYVVDPMGDKIRLDDSKWKDGHMAVVLDGLTGDDLAKKKKYLRAQEEERAMRRAGAIRAAKEKIKEAASKDDDDTLGRRTPGKIRYVADPLNEKLQKDDYLTYSKLDGVGKDDQKKREKLLRASLKAKFVPVQGDNGRQDLGKSAWQVSRGEDVLFSASVKEISAGNVDKLYSVIATKEFGRKLLEKVHSVGIEKAASMYKSAQTADLSAPPAPGAPAPSDLPPADLGTGGPGDMAGGTADDTGSDGDPKETALKLAEEMRDRSSDLLEAVRLLTGEQAEMGDVTNLAGGKAASLAPLFKMKKSLGKTLIQGMKRAVADLEEHREEMKLVSELAESGAIERVQDTVVEDALIDARALLDDTRKIMASFVSYANGSTKLQKRAQSMIAMPVAKPVLAPIEVHKADDLELVDDLGLNDDLELSAEELPDDPEVSYVDDEECDDENEVMMDVDPKTLENKKVEVKASNEPDLLTKAGRAQMRAKLAAQVLTFDPILNDAHRVVDYTPVPGSKDLAEFETIEEAQKKDVEIATQTSVRVRKEAERLRALVVKGAVQEKDLDGLVAKGLDAEVVKYYKELYGMNDKESKQFVADLLKTHASEKMAEEINKHKIKVSRAYDMANQMSIRGMIGSEPSTIASYVDSEIMNWNDDGFNSMKRIIAKTPVRKTAGLIPQVAGLSTFASSEHQSENFQNQLDQALSHLMPGRR